ncbi:MAG: putative lipoprotein [Fibrobacteres bacterium]|nr:putative lipoprotein [Fibrobacterota bacterium]
MKRILCLLPLFALVACEGKREDRSQVLAKIAGTSYTQSDFEFMLKTMTPDRQAEIMKDPEARRKQFNFMLKQKLQAMAAQKSKYGKSASLLGRQDLIDKRIITQAYFQTFLAENAGFTVADLEAYYKANSAKFANDSGRVLPFEDVRTRVADSMVVAKAPLDSFYQANSRKYEQKAACDLSLIQTKDKRTADEAAKALAGGLAFGDAAKKYSIHEASKTNQGKLGRQVKGETMWELGGNVNPDSLFFNDATKLKTGAVSRPIKKDSTWLLVKVDACTPQVIPPLETVRKQVGDDYLTQYKSKLSDNALANLKAKYSVKMVSASDSVSPAEIRKYYEAHKDNYFSPETYDVWHIESKSKDQLVKRAKDIKDLDGFKKLAGQYSENAWTKPAQGQIGLIKRDHCLPDGIGMMPALFSALDSMSPGLLPAPIQNPDTKKWHLFWLTAKFPKQAKAFERVQALAKLEYKSEKTNTIRPADTLAIYPKGHVIREKDVLFLREEIPAHMQDRYTREALVDYLLTWELATAEAKSLGLLDEVKMQAQREENRVNYWGQIYQDSIISRTAGLDSLTLKKTFETNRAFFTKDSAEKDYHKFVRDIAAFLTVDSKDLDIEYRTSPERYRKDTTALSFEESRYDIFQNLKGVAYAKAEDRQTDRLQREFQVVIMDPTLLPPKIKNPQEAYKQAQNLHYDRKLDVAVELYQRLRDEFPKNETLQDSICFGLAQIYIEQEKYQQALAEYRRLSYLYPKSSNNYKAMFMVGFIHAEHLKNDSAAVRAFEKMLAIYPSSDLSDDADWMIRNIRSGGKLMPVLEGDSGYVAPDSTKAAKTAAPAPVDSAKTAKAAKPAKAAAKPATPPAAEKPAKADTTARK